MIVEKFKDVWEITIEKDSNYLGLRKSKGRTRRILDNSVKIYNKRN